MQGMCSGTRTLSTLAPPRKALKAPHHATHIATACKNWNIQETFVTCDVLPRSFFVAFCGPHFPGKKTVPFFVAFSFGQVLRLLALESLLKT